MESDNVKTSKLKDFLEIPYAKLEELNLKAKERGMKTVIIDPMRRQAGPFGDKWLPVRPGTDLVFFNALSNVLIQNGYLDRPYLTKYSNMPFLVGPDGLFIKEGEAGKEKELVWDIMSNSAKPFDTAGINPALEGSYTAKGVVARPAFELLKENLAMYTPEYAAGITGLDAADIRASIAGAISVRIQEPVFESQTKTKLGSINISPDGISIRAFVNDYVKKETMLVVVFIALVAGFLGGVIYSAMKSPSPVGPVPSRAPQTQQQAPDPQSGFSQEDAARALSLEREVAATPDNVNAWIQLGNLYFDAGQFVKSINAYEKSLALAPGNANVLTDLGVMYRRNGQPEKAIDAFDRAREADPRHEQSRFNKGIVLRFDLNDRENAVKAWEELLQVNPNAVAPNGQPIKEAIKEL